MATAVVSDPQRSGGPGLMARYRGNAGLACPSGARSVHPRTRRGRLVRGVLTRETRRLIPRKRGGVVLAESTHCQIQIGSSPRTGGAPIPQLFDLPSSVHPRAYARGRWPPRPGETVVSDQLYQLTPDRVPPGRSYVSPRPTCWSSAAAVSAARRIRQPPGPPRKRMSPQAPAPGAWTAHRPGPRKW